jgi:hypothetical protein
MLDAKPPISEIGLSTAKSIRQCDEDYSLMVGKELGTVGVVVAELSAWVV